MMLAGIAVPDRRVLELARKLRDAGCGDTAARLESGYEHQAKLLALSVEERDEILGVLVDCPDGLGELRAVLLQQHEWRRREGIDAARLPAESHRASSRRPRRATPRRRPSLGGPSNSPGSGAGSATPYSWPAPPVQRRQVTQPTSGESTWPRTSGATHERNLPRAKNSAECTVRQVVGRRRFAVPRN